MSQQQNLRIPTPLHAQLKALAAKRGTTMVDVIHATVRQAIETGELPDEVPGLSVRVEWNLDAGEPHPFVIITTPAGELPKMDQATAEAVAASLCLEVPLGDETVRNRLNSNGLWAVGIRGTSVELLGKARNEPIEAARRVVMTSAIARAFAAKVRQVASSAH